MKHYNILKFLKKPPGKTSLSILNQVHLHSIQSSLDSKLIQHQLDRELKKEVMNETVNCNGTIVGERSAWKPYK